MPGFKHNCTPQMPMRAELISSSFPENILEMDTASNQGNLLTGSTIHSSLQQHLKSSLFLKKTFYHGPILQIAPFKKGMCFPLRSVFGEAQRIETLPQQQQSNTLYINVSTYEVIFPFFIAPRAVISSTALSSPALCSTISHSTTSLGPLRALEKQQPNNNHRNV